MAGKRALPPLIIAALMPVTMLLNGQIHTYFPVVGEDSQNRINLVSDVDK